MASKSDGNWFSRILGAFASLFGQKSAGASKRGQLQNSRQARRLAGHWPVWVELGKSTREQHSPREDSLLTLRFSATDAPLLRSLGINVRDFEGSYVPEKKSVLVQIPERLVQELMQNKASPVYVEAFLDGEPLGARKFNIPLQF